MAAIQFLGICPSSILFRDSGDDALYSAGVNEPKTSRLWIPNERLYRGVG